MATREKKIQEKEEKELETLREHVHRAIDDYISRILWDRYQDRQSRTIERMMKSERKRKGEKEKQYDFRFPFGIVENETS